MPRQINIKQKKTRFKQIKIINVSDAGVNYEYVYGNDRDTYELRDPQRQSNFIDIFDLVIGAHYYVCAANLGTTKRPKWFWIKAHKVTKVRAQEIFQIRRRFDDHDQIMPDIWERVVIEYGKRGHNAYSLWKGDHPEYPGDPTWIQLLVYLNVGKAEQETKKDELLIY